MSETKAGSVLDALQKANAIISLAIPVAGGLVSIGLGIVKMIRAGKEEAGTVVSYEVVLELGAAELDKTVALSKSKLEEVNAELVRLGEQPLSVPGE